MTNKELREKVLTTIKETRNRIHTAIPEEDAVFCVLAVFSVTLLSQVPDIVVEKSLERAVNMVSKQVKPSVETE